MAFPAHSDTYIESPMYWASTTATSSPAILKLYKLDLRHPEPATIATSVNTQFTFSSKNMHSAYYSRLSRKCHISFLHNRTHNQIAIRNFGLIFKHIAVDHVLSNQSKPRSLESALNDSVSDQKHGTNSKLFPFKQHQMNISRDIERGKSSVCSMETLVHCKSSRTFSSSVLRRGPPSRGSE